MIEAGDIRLRENDLFDLDRPLYVDIFFKKIILLPPPKKTNLMDHLIL